jgi:hypothetical protein
MSWSKWIRQTHRWLSMAFTLAVIANFVALGQMESDTYPIWLGLVTLLPLALLQLTGLYLLVLPHAIRWRSARAEERNP